MGRHDVLVRTPLNSSGAQHLQEPHSVLLCTGTCRHHVSQSKVMLHIRQLTRSESAPVRSRVRNHTDMVTAAPNRQA